MILTEAERIAFFACRPLDAAEYDTALIERDENDPSTWTNFNHPEQCTTLCQVIGKGKYRFNQYGSDGFAYWQYRFATKDAAIEWLCSQINRVVRVSEGHPQYEVFRVECLQPLDD